MIIVKCDKCSFQMEWRAVFSRLYHSNKAHDAEYVNLSPDQIKAFDEAFPVRKYVAFIPTMLCKTCSSELIDLEIKQRNKVDEELKDWITPPKEAEQPLER